MDTPIFEITYKNDFESFKKLNILLEDRVLGKSKKKTKLYGVIQISLSVIYLALILITKQPLGTLTTALAVGIFFFGLFSLTYYPIFFKKKLEKVVDKYFHETEYLQNEVSYQFYDTYWIETNVEDSKEIPYGSIDEIVEDETTFFLFLGRTGICFPKSSFHGGEKEFLKFINERITKADK